MMLDYWNTGIQKRHLFLMNRVATWANEQFEEENIETFRGQYDDPEDPTEAIGIVVCAGIYPHVDEGNAQFCHLLILRNDGFAVGERIHSPGEALILNIHEIHECKWKGSSPNSWDKERWIALFCDSHTRLSRHEAEAKFIHYLENFSED